MADEGSTSQEKTEEATPKRLREARKKGQVAKSRDLNTVVILIAAFGLLAVMIGSFSNQIQLLMKSSFDFVSEKQLHDEILLQFGYDTFLASVKMLGLYLGALTVIALLIGFFQVGPIFSAEPIKFQAKRLNIVENVKNMFKMTTFVELIKNVLKITLVFLIAYFVVKNNLREVTLTVTTDLATSTAVAGKLVAQFLLRVFILFVMLALLDVMVQRWQYKKQLRMSKEEVKREYKQDEGDPLLKSIRKQLHQELAMGDVRRAVGASDVVVTNPTELAIAIKYDEKEMMAPQIMAKGQRLFAQKIREVAEEEDVPILQNVPLAWSLIELDVGEEIPEELYAAAAEILVMVYKMKQTTQQTG